MTRTAITKNSGAKRWSVVGGQLQKATNNGQRTTNQSGYSLVALMAMMTLLAIAMMAVAPSIQQQIQREKELEAIRRGEEVAEAIRQYTWAYNGKYPNSIDDLLEGVPYGTKKRQILRESAAIDPLSEDGKWRLVGVQNKSMLNFARRVQGYNNGSLPTSENVHRTMLTEFGIAYTNKDSKDDDADTDASDSTDAEDEEISSDNTPFAGVVSQSKNKSFIAYYGIENHSKWIFTPLFRGAGSTPVPGSTGTKNPTRQQNQSDEIP